MNMLPLALTPTTVRRLAITRQLLAQHHIKPTIEGILEVINQLAYIQIDPLRTVDRTQFLVLWSRLGDYDRTHLDKLLWKERKLFEFWAHAASIVPTENFPIHQIQMRQFVNHDSAWGRRVKKWMRENEAFQQYILDELSERGDLTAAQIEDRSQTPWKSSGWSNNKNVGSMLSFLWGQGDIMVANRNGLNRTWRKLSHHFPQWAAHQPLSSQKVTYQAAQISLRALGVATIKQIANHYIRSHYTDLDTIVKKLVAERKMIPVTVKDKSGVWPEQWFIHADDRSLVEQVSENWQPRTTLLSPFDNLLIDRERTNLIWNFDFRLEIYLPKAKRKYGYYVMPILHGDKLVGRIDPKMNRKNQTLYINAIYAEPNEVHNSSIGQALVQDINKLGEFLGAKEIIYSEKHPAQWGLFNQ